MNIENLKRQILGHKFCKGDGGGDGGGGGGGESSGGDYSNEGRNYSTPTSEYSGPMSLGWDGSGATGDAPTSGWTGTRAERDARANGNMSAGDAEGGMRGSSFGFNAAQAGWGFGSDGNVYGDLRAASRDLGVPASELGPNGGMRSLAKAPGFAGMFGGWLADMYDKYDIPGYAMTPEERAEAAAAQATRGGGNSARAQQMAMQSGAGRLSADGQLGLTGDITDKLIHDPTNTAQTGWDRWLNVDQPWMDARLGKISTAADTSAGQMGGLAINSIEDYNNIGRPAFQNLNNYVNRLGNADYQAQQRGLAMEGVDGQFNLQDQALQRKFAGMGMGSGAMADALASQQANRAMAKVAAATKSDQDLNKMYGDGLGTLSSLGLKLGDFATNNSKGALAATSVPFEFGSKLANDGFTAARNTGSILDSRTNAAANTTAAASGKMNAQTNAQAQSDSLTNTLLGVGASAGLKWLFG